PLLTLLPDDDDVDALVARAVDARPESAQVEALVAAAEVDLTAERKGLFIPNVSLNYTSGLFGGGPGSAIRNSGHRDDLTLTLYWQLDGFGLGNRARRDEREAQLRRAGFERARLRDAIAAEVRAAHAQLTSARAQLDLVAAAIERARAAYESHRTRIYDQQGLPLEALAAMQTLAAAELAELDARAAYSVAQVRLHTALGNPV